MPKTILILAADPKNTPRLRLDQEVREIDNGLQRAQRRDEFILKQVWAVRRSDFRRAMLDSKPNIVHFCGHGSGEEGIAFEDENGQAILVSKEALSGFFELFADTVECVVLNACYSETQAEAIAEHIPHVIGMNKAIGDSAAIEFAVAFYDALGVGKTIEFAYKLACNAIQLSGLPENLTPVLKPMRSSSSSILEPDVARLQEQINQLSTNERKFFDALDEQTQHDDDVEITGKLKIFLASPSDVHPERKVAIDVLRTLAHSFDFDIYGWEETIPQLGNPADVIDNQIPARDCHVVVAIFWKRFGTPNGKKRPDGTPYLSGTQYEVEQAIDAFNKNSSGRPRVMIYQKMDDPWSDIKGNPDGIIQYGRLLDYLREFDPSGQHPALICPFSRNGFRDVFRKHIVSVLQDLGQKQKVAILTTPSEHESGEQWVRKVGLTSITLGQEPAGIEGDLSNENLQSRIAFWLTSISEDKRAPYRSVGQLCDDTERLANRIDDEIVELAQSSPQNARWLIERIFQVHCEDNAPPRLIQPSTWQRVRFEWETQIRRSAAPVYRPGFRIEAQRMYFGERSLVLTGRCPDLLRKLIEKQGDVCTYADLIAVGWPQDDPSGVARKALQESMRRLRIDLQKKYQIDAVRWIETVYNQGYRLRLPNEITDQIDAAKRGV